MEPSWQHRIREKQFYTKGTRNACSRCRLKHLRCDSSNPCDACFKLGVECSRGWKWVNLAECKGAADENSRLRAIPQPSPETQSTRLSLRSANRTHAQKDGDVLDRPKPSTDYQNDQISAVNADCGGLLALSRTGDASTNAGIQHAILHMPAEDVCWDEKDLWPEDLSPAASSGPSLASDGIKTGDCQSWETSPEEHLGILGWRREQELDSFQLCNMSYRGFSWCDQDRIPWAGYNINPLAW